MLSYDMLMRSASETGVGRNGRSGFARLIFTRKEAAAIMAVIPRKEGKEELDFSANRATATSPDLAQYRTIHFATHGLVNSQHPELSGLVLSLVDKHGNAQDGFLQLQDIYNLRLQADLVVLSACETALGKEIQGEGLIGLTQGFMYAGASRVVASLWKVSDVATARLMGEFYRAMEKDGMPASAALRAAQIKMLKQKRWHDSYFWAAFQIQGEWR
jgi:CHAT domain-containing protein